MTSTPYNQLLPRPARVLLRDGFCLLSRASRVFHKDPEIPSEGYRLRIAPGRVDIWAGDDAGAFYAGQTLRQLGILSRGQAVPCASLQDAPRFSWRGFMLDSARHYQRPAAILRLLKVLAFYKINRLHWHLCDNYAWRIAIPGHPELQKPTHRPYYGRGCYGEDELKKILAFAKKNFIQVIPEVEMPAHSGMVFRDHPELACPHPSPYRGNIYEYCLGNPAVKIFLRDVLLEIRRLFPDAAWCHIGGDEARKEIWENCPVCAAERKRRGLPDAAAQEEDFMHEMAEFTASLGFRPIVWAGCRDYGKKVILQGWRKENLEEALQSGNDVINSIHNYAYLDYPAEKGEDRFDWMPELPLKKVYAFQPVPPGVLQREAKRIVGSEACLWTERVPEKKLFPKVFPRLCAFAEKLWSRKRQAPWTSFRKALASHLDALQHVYSWIPIVIFQQKKRG